MKKVKCVVCVNSDGKRCVIKNVKVAQRKSRKCDSFAFEVGKVQVKQSIQASYTPPHMRSRKAYKQFLKEQEEQVFEAEEAKSVDMKSPDILSRYRSTSS